MSYRIFFLVLFLVSTVGKADSKNLKDIEIRVNSLEKSIAMYTRLIQNAASTLKTIQKARSQDVRKIIAMANALIEYSEAEVGTPPGSEVYRKQLDRALGEYESITSQGNEIPTDKEAPGSGIDESESTYGPGLGSTPAAFSALIRVVLSTVATAFTKKALVDAVVDAVNSFKGSKDANHVENVYRSGDLTSKHVGECEACQRVADVMMYTLYGPTCASESTSIRVCEIQYGYSDLYYSYPGSPVCYVDGYEGRVVTVYGCFDAW